LPGCRIAPARDGSESPVRYGFDLIRSKPAEELPLCSGPTIPFKARLVAGIASSKRQDPLSHRSIAGHNFRLSECGKRVSFDDWRAFRINKPNRWIPLSLNTGDQRDRESHHATCGGKKRTKENIDAMANLQITTSRYFVGACRMLGPPSALANGLVPLGSVPLAE